MSEAEVDNWINELIEEYKKNNPHIDVSGDNICLGLVNKDNGNKITLRKHKGEWVIKE